MDKSTTMYIGLFLIIGLILGGIWWYKKYKTPKTTSAKLEEGFLNTPLTYKIQNLVTDNNNGIYYSAPGFDNFYSPRFSTFDSNAVIPTTFGLHPPTGSRVSAVPSNPLGYQSPTLPQAALYSAQVAQPAQTSQCSSCTTQGTIVNQLNNDTVTVDRLIFANRNSNLRSMGDPIRGDLPIVPNPPGWFTPSVTPSIDLQRGAMNVLAGSNEVTNDMSNLLLNTTNGLTSGNYFNTTNSAFVQLGNRGDDIIVSSYP